MDATMTFDQTHVNLVHIVDNDADRGLLDRFRRLGDQEALGQLLERHASTAYRVARRFAGNDADADDVLQEAFISCMASAKHFRGEGSVRSWIVGIVANAHRRRRRALQRRRKHEQRASAAPPSTRSNDHEREQVLTCLQQLPDRYRMPVSMRYIDDLDFLEIASALGSKEKSVRTRVSRGLERMRESLSRRGVVMSVAVAGAALAQTANAAEPAHLSALMHTSLAKGASLPASGLATAAVGGSSLTLKALAALFAVCAIGAGVHVALRTNPPPAAVAEAAPAAQPAGLVARALDQHVSLFIHDSLTEAITRLRGQLPRELRPVFFEVSSRMQWQGPNSVNVTKVAISIADRPLREVFDAICAGNGLRWRTSSVGIFIDRPSQESQRLQLLEAFEKSHGDAVGPAVNALRDCGDLDCLRPLLLALNSDGAKTKVIEESLAKICYNDNGLSFYCDDEEIRAAFLDAWKNRQKPSYFLLWIAGRLRVREVADDCLAIARSGLERQSEGKTFDVVDRMAGGAAEALGMIGEARVVDALVDVAQRSNSGYLRQAAIIALGEIGDPRAVDPLLELMRQPIDWNTPFPSIHELSITALGLIGDERATKPVGDYLLEPVSNEAGVNSVDGRFAKDAAIKALRRIGSAGAIDYLLKCARTGERGRWSGPSPVEELAYCPGSEVEKTLFACLDDPSARGSVPPIPMIAQAIARRTDAKLVDRLKERILLEQAGAPNNPLVPEAIELFRMQGVSATAYANACKSLAMINLASARQALLDTLPPVGGELFLVHIDALARCETAETTAYVLRLVDPGQDPRSRLAAANCLAACGTDGLARLSQLVLADSDDEVRKQAILGCRELAYKNAIPRSTLVSWLEHPDAVIRATTFQVFSYMANQPDQDFNRNRFRMGMMDPEETVRIAAIERLYSPTPLLAGLCSRLAVEDLSVNVRIAAASRLSHITQDMVDSFKADEFLAVVDSLLKAAQSDMDPQARANAAWSLVHILHSNEKAIEKLGTDVNRHRQAIAKLGQEDPDARVRFIVAKVFDSVHAAQVGMSPSDWVEAGQDHSEITKPVPAGADDF
jgi:RNA polymerase sigma-70 factor (ECF subfamily)